MGAMSPSMEYTDSKATSLARPGSISERCRSRSSGSLWRKMRFSARLWRMPSIIDAWLPASESTTQFGSREARVPSEVQLDT